MTVVILCVSQFYYNQHCAQAVNKMQGEVVLKVFRGTVKSYDRKTGKGWIALEGEDDVQVDLFGSRGIWLAVGQQVEFRMIHRLCGVYALDATVVPHVLE